jgi:hypothetical protein
LRWYKHDYRYVDGQRVPASLIQGESALGTKSYKQFVKHSSYLCIGKREDCGGDTLPNRLPPGPGWHEATNDRRIEIRVPDH